MDERFCFYLYLPKGTTKDNAKSRRLAVIVHNTFRDAEHLTRSFADFADASGTILIAPLFPCGIYDKSDIDNYKFLRYRDIAFDRILLDIIEEMVQTLGLTEKKFLFYGFSGGAQFVHRMLYLFPEYVRAAVIAAPGRITYLSEELPWPDGIKDMESLLGCGSINYKDLQNIPIQILVGEADTEFIDYRTAEHSGPLIEKFGRSRLERVIHLQEIYAAHGLDSDLMVLPNCGHVEGPMIAQAKTFFLQIK